MTVQGFLFGWRWLYSPLFSSTFQVKSLARAISQSQHTGLDGGTTTQLLQTLQKQPGQVLKQMCENKSPQSCLTRRQLQAWTSAPEENFDWLPSRVLILKILGREIFAPVGFQTVGENSALDLQTGTEVN